MTKVQSSITSIQKVTRKPLRFPEEEIKKSHEERRIYGAYPKSGGRLRFGKYKKMIWTKNIRKHEKFFEEKIKTL